IAACAPCGALYLGRPFDPKIDVRRSKSARAVRWGACEDAETTMAQANELRKGTLVSNQGRVCSVIYWNLWKSDRRSRVQMKLKDVLNGRITEVTAQPD